MATYENIAWFGGSYSPPTKMHVRVAIEIGKTLLKNTSPGKQCCVAIVPVSGKYKKGSVRDECISQADRWALANAFVEAIQADIVHELESRASDLHFKLLDYEFTAGRAVPTIESLEILKSQPFCTSETNIYIAQGQDNILAIMARKWTKSDELLSKYSFFMFPRGDSSVKNVTIQMIQTLITKTPEQKYMAVSIDEAFHIVKKVEFVGEGFSDDTSSSKVRKLIQDAKGVQHAQLEQLLHPHVLEKIQQLNSSVYIDESCEKTPAAGGSRRSTQKFKHRHISLE